MVAVALNVALLQKVAKHHVERLECVHTLRKSIVEELKSIVSACLGDARVEVVGSTLSGM